MDPIPAVFDRSVQRSRVRRAVLLMLSSLGEAHIGQLSRITGIPWSRVRSALLGKLPEFAPDLALVPLGLARPVKKGRGTVYVITTKGRRKARSITASYAHRRGARVRAGEGGTPDLSGGFTRETT